MKLATLFTVQTLTESEKKAFRMQYGIPYVIADDGGTIHYPTASDYHMARDVRFIKRPSAIFTMPQILNLSNKITLPKFRLREKKRQSKLF